DVLPVAVLEGVDGRLLVGGGAELVERDLAGDSVEGDVLHGLGDLLAGVVGQLAVVVLDDLLHGLDDRPGRVVGVAAVGLVGLLVAGVLVVGDELLGGGQLLHRGADRGGQVAGAARAGQLDEVGAVDAVTADQRDLG